MEDLYSNKVLSTDAHTKTIVLFELEKLRSLYCNSSMKLFAMPRNIGTALFPVMNFEMIRDPRAGSFIFRDYPISRLELRNL